MRIKIVGVVAVIGSIVIFGAGCAKQEMVKSDQPVASTPPAETKKAVDTPSATNNALQELRITTETPPAVVPKVEPKEVKLSEEHAAALADVYFSFDSYKLDGAAREALYQNFLLLKKGAAKIRIEGNCDEQGSDEYNQALGEKRAKAALQYLVKLGIPEKNISVISYGEEKPVDPGHDEAAWAKNRHDHFLIIAQ